MEINYDIMIKQGGHVNTTHADISDALNINFCPFDQMTVNPLSITDILYSLFYVSIPPSQRQTSKI